MCVERVAADLMGLTSATAVALKRELKQPSEEGSDDLVRQWCEFYANELLPETKKFCKKVTGKLDAYGLYLPSRMSASLSPELLERGLKLGGGGGDAAAAEGGDDEDDEEEKDEGGDASDDEKTEKSEEAADVEGRADAKDASVAMSSAPAEDEYDEYEYDEYDEYDD